MNSNPQQQRSGINPEILQDMLESATNAAEKGQSQFFTPIEFGQKLATALPRFRPCVVDLNCGNGQLIQATANKSTLDYLGADIDNCRALTGLTLSRITYDVTKLYPLLKEVRFQADLFALNPPWRLFFHRERLLDLADSALPAVRQAFKAHDDGVPKGTIDSTIAVLLMALDLCNVYGEGFLIANEATLHRLIFAPGAPCSAILKHIWAHVILPGNPMTGLTDCQWKKDEEFKTGVIYFARDHTNGPRQFTADTTDLATLPVPERHWRQGGETIAPQLYTKATPDHWRTVKEQVRALESAKPAWNLWLQAGVIQTHLSRFEKDSVKVDKNEAQRLFALQGKVPMQLVLQRAQREELMHVAQEANWRVHPDLLTAITQAVQEYHAARAPLYPLPEIQRLGYLDENDFITCKQDLTLEFPSPPRPGRGVRGEVSSLRIVFQKGKDYPLRTETVAIERTTYKPNSMTGEPEEIQSTGQQLAIFISFTEDDEYCFMDGVLRDDKKTTVKDARKTARVTDSPIDFTLQDLCAHFIIPEVPDVAAINPEGYAHHIAQLEELEQLTEQFA